MAEYNVSAELTRFLTPRPPLLFPFPGIPIPVLGFSYSFPMLVAALALAYLTAKVKGGEYRMLFVILIIFSLLHIVYHYVVGTGLNTGDIFLVRLGREFLDPIDIWILAAFGLLYLRRELRVGG